MLMMMRVSVTSVLLILGIFCSPSWAQPEGLSEVADCMRPAEQECLRPLQAAFPGPPPQIQNQVVSTDLSETCAPLLTARDCVTRKMEECGIFDLTHPEVLEAMRYLRVANRVLNYVCRDHVEVFDGLRICLSEPGVVAALEDAVQRQCPMPSRPFGGPCVPRDLSICATNLVAEQCGEEIGGHLRTVDEMVLEEFGCEGTRKHFKMMKKNIESPLELISEAFSSLF